MVQVASAGGHEAVVWLLLEKNVDINAQGGEDGSTLQVALAGGHKAIIQLLLEKNADVNAQLRNASCGAACKPTGMTKHMYTHSKSCHSLLVLSCSHY